MHEGALLRDLEKKVNVQSSEISFLKPELARKVRPPDDCDLVTTTDVCSSGEKNRRAGP